MFSGTKILCLLVGKTPQYFSFKSIFSFQVHSDFDRAAEKVIHERSICRMLPMRRSSWEFG
jgi:hypothetical protein